MKDSRRSVRSGSAVRLRLDRLEDRTLLSAVSCTLTNGVLATSYCTDHDYIEVDRDPASQTIAVLYNYQTFQFPAAQVQSLRITGMTGNDLLLLDTNLGLPTYLGATLNGSSLNGWVEVNPQPGSPVAHQHETSNYVHWIIWGWTYQNGWNFVPGPPGSDQSSQSAASLSGVSFGSLSFGSGAFLSGHLFHSLSGGTNLSLVDFTGMTEHGFGLYLGATDAGHGGGSSHDSLANPPYQEVGHKPG